jgi:hypothetical protein
MNAAFLLAPGVGGAPFRTAAKAVSALGIVGIVGRVANKADNFAKAGVKAAKLDNVGDLLKAVEKADFATDLKKTEHFLSHGAKMGFKNADEYVQGARSLLKEGLEGKGNLFKRGNDLIAVNPRTGTLSIFDTQNGVIRTFFTPNEGYNYSLRNMKTQGWVRLHVG